MSNRGVLAGIAVVLVAGTLVEAATIKIWVGNNRRTGDGGEFIASNWTSDLTYNGKAIAYGFATDVAVQASALAQHGLASPAFGTFCLETQEHVSGNTTYGAQLNHAAIKGGVGPQGDALDYQTKWLYWNYRNNTLAAADFVNGTNAQMQARTRALQLAIWSFEEPGYATPNALANTMIADANAAYAQHLLGNGQIGVGRVVAINLGTAANEWKFQDQMAIVVPLPTAGGMSLAGLLGVLAIRRRVRL